MVTLQNSRIIYLYFNSLPNKIGFYIPSLYNASALYSQLNKRKNRMKRLNLQELHIELLKMADEFHSICQKERIPYYMLGGTMLGAVRHKGFIPWDDDMDFGVPRGYEHKLINALVKRLPDKYELLTYRNSALCTDCMKINLKNSQLVFDDDEIDSRLGGNIDVFILDYANSSHCWLSENGLIHILVKYNTYAFCHSQVQSKVKRIVRMFNILPKSFALNIVRYLSLRKKDNYSCIANHSGFWGLREIVPRNIFGVPRTYTFEGREYLGVDKPDSYLKLLYGDYMKLPSEDKRHTHFKYVLVEE